MADYTAGPDGIAYVSLFVLDTDGDPLTGPQITLIAKGGVPIAVGAPESAPAWLSQRVVEEVTYDEGGSPQTRLHLEMGVDIDTAGTEGLGTYEAELRVTDKAGPHAFSFSFEVAYEALLLDHFDGSAGPLSGHAPNIAPAPGGTPAVWAGNVDIFELDGNGSLTPPSGHVGPSRAHIEIGAANHTVVADLRFGSLSGTASVLARLADDGALLTALQLELDPQAEEASLRALTDDGTSTSAPIIGFGSFPLAPSTLMQVAVECDGTTITVRVAGDPIISASSTHSQDGTFCGLEATGDACRFDRLAATPN